MSRQTTPVTVEKAQAPCLLKHHKKIQLGKILHVLSYKIERVTYSTPFSFHSFVL